MRRAAKRTGLVASVISVVMLAASLAGLSSPANAQVMVEPPPIASIDPTQPANLSLRAVTLAEAPGWDTSGLPVTYDYGLTSDATATEPTESITYLATGNVVLDLTAHNPSTDWYVVARANTTMFGSPYTTAWSAPYIVAGPDFAGAPLPDPLPIPDPMPIPDPAPIPQPTVLKWVALGDSYSSGEGVKPFIAGTNIKGDQCHRSTFSYSEDVVRSAPNKYSLEFRACSGAVFADLYSPNHDNRLEATPQLDWVHSDTDIVTLTIGGNDAYFADIMTYCATRTRFMTTCQKKWQAKADKVLKRMSTMYADVIYAIKQKAPNAHVYLLGYPRFFPIDAPMNCPTDAPGGYVFGQSDMIWINSEVKAADAAAKSGALLAGATYVDTYDMVGTKHDLCSSEPWINRVIAFPKSHRVYSFHPNAMGQSAESQILETYLP